MPHPCAIDGTLEGCAELAAQHVSPIAEVIEVGNTAVTSIKAALIANAPAITEHLDAAMLKVGEWVEATEALVITEAPLLVKEIVWWGVAEAGFWVVLGTLGMLCLPAALFYLRKSEGLKEYGGKVAAALGEDGQNGDFAMALIGCIVIPLFGATVASAHIMDMLKPLVAPRLFLIEYFKALTG
jgi:hypothetical protein